MTLTDALQKKMATMGVVKEDGVGKPTFISSGSLGLDLAMSGGLPRGQLTTISSEIPGYGKDTLVNLFIRAITTAPPGAMLNGGRVLIFNQERKMRSEWLRKMGANLDKVDIVHAKSGEIMFADILKNILEDNYDLIVVNSVTATSFAAEIEAVMAVKKESTDENGKKVKSNGFDQGFIAIAAKHWAFARKVMTNPLADSNVALVTINQSSAVIGSLYPMADTEYGGKALLAWASLRLNLLAPKIVQSTDAATGEINDTLTVRPNIIKNTFMTRRIVGTEVGLVNGILNSVADVVKLGKAYAIFTKQDGSPLAKNGNWFYDGQLVGGSAADVQAYLLNNPDTYDATYAQVSALASSTSLPATSELFETPVNELIADSIA